MNSPNRPHDSDAAWEVAMSRDFDARVRDLHEAPLDVESVKGRARTIRRNRRAAVAGGVLGIAAIVTPIAVLSDGTGSQTREPDFAENPTETLVDPSVSSSNYLLDGVWHQSDGDEVALPKTNQSYDAAVLWNDQLVVTRWDGEVYSVADVIDQSGAIVDSFRTTAPVVVDDSGSTIAWIDTDGAVMTAWEGGATSLGTVDLGAPGEAVAYSVTAVAGGPDCSNERDGCLVYVQSGLGDSAQVYSAQGVTSATAAGAMKVFDAHADDTGLVISVLSDVTDDLNTCGGLYEYSTEDYRWQTCDHQVQQISPDGSYVAAPQSQFDGLGPTRLSILDASTGDLASEFERSGWTVGTWSWTAEGALAFTAFEGRTWHLLAMAPDGEITELATPVRGDEFASPFVLVHP